MEGYPSRQPETTKNGRVSAFGGVGEPLQDCSKMHYEMKNCMLVSSIEKKWKILESCFLKVKPKPCIELAFIFRSRARIRQQKVENARIVKANQPQAKILSWRSESDRFGYDNFISPCFLAVFWLKWNHWCRCFSLKIRRIGMKIQPSSSDLLQTAFDSRLFMQMSCISLADRTIGILHPLVYPIRCDLRAAGWWAGPWSHWATREAAIGAAAGKDSRWIRGGTGIQRNCGEWLETRCCEEMEAERDIQDLSILVRCCRIIVESVEWICRTCQIQSSMLIDLWWFGYCLYCLAPAGLLDSQQCSNPLWTPRWCSSKHCAHSSQTTSMYTRNSVRIWVEDFRVQSFPQKLSVFMPIQVQL